MACFVLPSHATADILHKMLRSFRERVNQRSFCGEQVMTTPERRDVVTYEFLHSMKSLQGSQDHHILYWPLSDDPTQWKRCLLANRSKCPGSETHNNVYLIPITDFIKKIHPEKKNRFMPCDCKDHSKRIRLNWREFIYPQFVDFLFKRVQLPSSCPSPSATNAHCIVNEKLQFSMEIDNRASFLSDVEGLRRDLFRLSCNEMTRIHKNRHLEMFGRENVEGWYHFSEQHITDANFKLLFKLHQPRIRATHIMGGGRISLKATTSSSEPYVLFASNFFLLPGKDTPHYRVYVMAPDKQHAILAYEDNTRISSSKLCQDGELCMIVSSSRLTLEFKPGMAGYFVLATDAGCKVALGSDYRLSLWTRDHQCAWPMKYEIVSLCCSRTEEDYYACILARYDALFNDPPFYTGCIESPAQGYTSFRLEEEVFGCTPKGEPLCRKLIKYELLSHNQYSSMSSYINDECPEISALPSFFKKRSDTEPTFPGMHIVYEKRPVLGKLLKLRGLCREGESTPWCYFFINREKTYLLFIPVF